MVKLALLTAQRREVVTIMKWSDLAGATWTIPAEARAKDHGGLLVLPDIALAVIEQQPRVEGCPYVFAGRTSEPFSGMSKAKARLDAKSGVAGWTLHDLRRTARSLMARAGVRPDVAEVMGHAIAGVEGVYDRHDYRAEKADALRRLAVLLATILQPPGQNVVPLPPRGA